MPGSQTPVRQSPQKRRSIGSRGPAFWRSLGPGLITGAADDDPSGIATYAQAGAQYGFALAWTLVLAYPLMVAIQAICARIGRTTGRGIAGNLREHYPTWTLSVIVGLLFAANVLNIGADLGAMTESLRLLVPVPVWLGVLLFGVITASGQILLEHTRYVAILKWLTLSLLAYFGALASVRVPWTELIHGLVWPGLHLDQSFWLIVVAIFGTTISPYLFFWQAGQEVEDTKSMASRQPLLRQPSQATRAFARIRLDTLVGMGFSNLVALAILITSAVTLKSGRSVPIETAAQAAVALRPIAGAFASLLFALGIIGTGLLSVPVLAGSAAYALGEARRWPVGLSRAPLRAKAFYTSIALAITLGAIANLLRIGPMKALVWAALLNGIVSVPVMAMVMLLGARTDVMGRFCISRRLKLTGWTATALMAVASVVFLYSSL